MAPKRRGSGGEGGDIRGGKRGKKWAPQGQSKGPVIPTKSTGFLVSCVGGKEYLASREAIELISQYVEKEAGPSEEPAVAASSDISALIAEEVKDLRSPAKQPLHWHKTGMTGLLYIAINESAAAGLSPSKLVHAMASDIKAAQHCKSRLCLRFIPVEHVCHASLDDIKNLAERAVPAALPPLPDGAEQETFAVLYEHRASASLDRMGIINAFVDQVPKGYKVDLDKSKHTIVVQLVKSCCTVAVVQDYKELMRFNIRELSGTGEPKEEKKAGQKQKPAETAADRKAAAPAAAEAAEPAGADPKAAAEEASAGAAPLQPTSAADAKAAAAEATVDAAAEDSHQAATAEGG